MWPRTGNWDSEWDCENTKILEPIGLRIKIGEYQHLTYSGSTVGDFDRTLYIPRCIVIFAFKFEMIFRITQYSNFLACIYCVLFVWNIFDNVIMIYGNKKNEKSWFISNKKESAVNWSLFLCLTSSFKKSTQSLPVTSFSFFCFHNILMIFNVSVISNSWLIWKPGEKRIIKWLLFILGKE